MKNSKKAKIKLYTNKLLGEKLLFQAIQFTGDNIDDIKEFVGENNVATTPLDLPKYVIDTSGKHTPLFESDYVLKSVKYGTITVYGEDIFNSYYQYRSDIPNVDETEVDKITKKCPNTLQTLYCGCKDDDMICKRPSVNEQKEDVKRIEIVQSGKKLQIKAVNLKHYEIIGMLRYCLVGVEKEALKESAELYSNK